MTPRGPRRSGGASGARLERYRAAVAAFRGRYGRGPVTLYRAPGRVNLIGEHTDYNGGYVLPAAIDRELLVLARPRADRRLCLANAAAVEPPNWTVYVDAVAGALGSRLDRPLAGLDLLVDGEGPLGLPRGAGLSSSSALCVGLALAMAEASGARPLSAQALAEVCREAEWQVGTRGGIMDQLTLLCARPGQVLFIDCRAGADGRYAIEPLPLPARLRLMVVDSGVAHANTSGAFNRRVAACRAGAGLLAASHPGTRQLRDVEDRAWPELEPGLPEQATVAELGARGIVLDDIPGLKPSDRLAVRARCRHVWHENHRVLAAREVLARGEPERLGALMDAAHASARDDYAISCPELELLVGAARQVPGCLGARLTGAGWGGCSVALVEASAAAALRARLIADFTERFGRQPTIFDCRPGGAAGRAARFD
ncbi:MAG: hypothetical protein H6648_05090 [Caldilineae bacterium]|nr:hypothetical protein [Chloroflexota bacterium]MCB9176517.1 hypothetical protein [Caldilineae bacterium]